MTEDAITASDMPELESLCAGMAKGRLISSHHADEQRTIATVLPALCLRCGYDFPLTLIHQDKPDFLLNFSGHRIGIEVTQFLATSLAHATKTAKRLNIGFTPTIFDFDSPRRTREEMEHAIQEPSIGLNDWRPIADPSYIDQIMGIVESKKQKILIDGLSSVDEHWLLIDDQYHILDVEISFVVEQSLIQLNSHWSEQQHFSKILILSDSILVDLNAHDPGWKKI